MTHSVHVLDDIREQRADILADRHRSNDLCYISDAQLHAEFKPESSANTFFTASLILSLLFELRSLFNSWISPFLVV